MKNTHVMKTILFLLMVSALALSACGGKTEETPTPTAPSVEEVQTNTVATFSAALTQTALVMPTSTPIPTNTLIPTFPVVTSTAGSIASPVPTASCYRLVYLKDVTIPDNTPMKPGEAFTKTWLVQNTGSCTWDVGFRFNVIGGNAMSGVALTLTQEVAPNAQLELSVPMIVPTDVTGTVSGSWRMADANGGFFGDALTVVILVSGSATTATATATGGAATPTATSTETPTPTP